MVALAFHFHLTTKIVREGKFSDQFEEKGEQAN